LTAAGEYTARFGVERVALVGCRGCGKTSVGRLVAQQLGWEFVDTDGLVEARAGRTIAEIFRAEGEAAFRALERQVLLEVLGRPRCVVSVGGGAVLNAASRDDLCRLTLCIWLMAPASELYRRIQSDQRSADQRPPLTDAGGLAEVEQVLAERRALYEAVAAHVVETAGRGVVAVAREVVELVAAGAEGP